MATPVEAHEEGTGPVGESASQPAETSPRREEFKDLVRRLFTEVGLVVISFVILVALWLVVIRIYDLHPFYARRPPDVFNYLFTDPEAAANRTLILERVPATLRDMLIGYVAGTLVGLSLALGFYVSRTAKALVMPWVLIFQTIPILVFIALIVIWFGRGLLSVALISGLITFFPTLIYATAGLSSASKESCDLLRVYGASEWTILLRVRLIYSLRYVTAAAKIAVPGSLGGALLAELLATGEGVGYFITSYNILPRAYDVLWSSVGVIVVLASAIYTAVTMIEFWINGRFKIDSSVE